MEENSSIKEQALRIETAVRVHSGQRSEVVETIENHEALDERLSVALHAASEKKANDPVVLDLREIASFTDFFIITSGNNARQVQAIADEIVERLKKKGTRATRIEGRATAEWVLVDYGDFVVHVFDEKARKFYDLERLWRDAKRVELSSELISSSPSSLTVK